MKHTIVFGGSRGIGASIAQVLLSNNYNVSIISRSSENMKIFIETVMENNGIYALALIIAHKYVPHAITRWYNYKCISLVLVGRGDDMHMALFLVRDGLMGLSQHKSPNSFTSL